MAGRYERVGISHSISRDGFGRLTSNVAQVNAHDDDEPETPTSNTLPRQIQPIPNSPPPSFHSRRSSLTSRDRNLQVNPDLADAFESDGEWSDDEADDRQRLVRSNTSPVDTSAPEQLPTAQNQTTSQPPPAPTATGSRVRGVFGGGIQSDGVFSNLTAKPERGGVEKEEQPPVCQPLAVPHPCRHSVACANFLQCRHTNKQQQMPHHHTGRQLSWRQALAAPTRSTSTACRSVHSSALSGTA